MIHVRVIQHPLDFIKPGGTSRGVLNQKPTWYLHLTDENGNSGWGECSLIPKLSIDPVDELEKVLADWNNQKLSSEELNESFDHARFPALSFALETALIDLKQAGEGILFPSEFTNGKALIPINGLIWMAPKADMLEQVKSKLEAGFTCIKLKIGAIDFEEELEVLKFIRSQFTANEIEIRVDANGAFNPQDALEKLNRLSAFHLHSIEQPIKQNQWEQMAQLCASTPLPIALDEELIGISDSKQKAACLDAIQPQYIILKPSLVGGLSAAKEWIDLAEERNIGWWNTSALESNVGLNAIAQWTFTLNTDMPQGLGTGQLFKNNTPSPLYMENGQVGYNPNESWSLL